MHKLNQNEVVVINCGLGNIFNLCRAICLAGKTPILSDAPEIISNAGILILPGVGSFNTGIARLNERGLSEAIKSFVEKGNPLLGICLGMQLLFDSSEENGNNKGLGLIAGNVKRLDPENVKLPQINWNYLTKPRSDTDWNKGILKNLTNPCMYFIHSYGVSTKESQHVFAKTNYGKNEYCSVTNKENIWGCQFHPEISGKQGLKLLENFLVGC